MNIRTYMLAFAALWATPVAAQDAVRTEADGSRTLVTEVIVPAPQSEVWAAISTPAGWMSWAVPIAWAPDADTIETSYQPNAKAGDASTIVQKISGREPGRMLRFVTTKAPQGFPDFDTYKQVVSIFRLDAVIGGTRVRLTQTGYPATEAGTRLLGFFEKGNKSSLEALRDRFVRGPVDWKARGVTK
jgi:uncharacterized protein YndB with AHSA1/START domain